MLGCENAAAEPYMKVCCLNDLRSHLAWGTGGIPVPLYSFVFHEYAAGFSGNGVCLSGWVDVERTPFFLQWTMGWNFACRQSAFRGSEKRRENPLALESALELPRTRTGTAD